MDREQDGTLSNGQLALIIAIVIVAALLRIWWNDVPRYSPADETVYADTTRQLLHDGFFHGYPSVVASFLSDPGMAVYPSPLRYGYFALSTLTAGIAGHASPDVLAGLSTLCGILMVPLVFFLSLRLFGKRAAMVAAAFTAFSCIELALGRRALQDEVVCFVVFLALTLLLLTLEDDSRGSASRLALLVGAIAAMTLAFAVKESFLLLVPALLAVLLVYRRPRQLRLRHAMLFLLPPLFYYLGFCALAHDFTSFFGLGRMVTSAMTAPYVVQYQGGPPHRLLFDYFITAPFVSLLATAAVAIVAMGTSSGRRERSLALFLVISLAVFGVLPSKNLRFTVMVDPVVRMLAAWFVATRGFRVRTMVAAAAANAAVELELFYRIFAQGGVYDPVTQELLKAVGALPHTDATAPSRMLFPWICAAIFAAAWIWPRSRPQSR